MGADGGAIDHLDVAVMRDGDGIHQSGPHAGLPPSYEAVVARGAWAVALGQVTPWCAGAQNPEDAVQHAPIIDTRNTSRLVWEQWRDHSPLEVGQVISAHPDLESAGERRGKHLR